MERAGLVMTMAETHAARLSRLESRDKLILLLVDRLDRERAEYQRTIERMTARIEKLEREANVPPLVLWDKVQRAGLS